jgi:SPP1 gp7 family putative phage head morphogenesis protein
MNDKPLRPGINLAPTETVKFFRAKGARILTSHWTDLWQEEHVRSFTVSKINDLTTLNAIYRELDTVVADGGTLEMFKSKLLPDLRAPVKAGTAPLNILSDQRLRTIYQTNLRMARAAGLWERIQSAKKAVPYLMYRAIDDDHTRPEHRKWGGLDGGKPIILPVDHPIWKWLFPPNGWGCRCQVIALSQRDLEARGLTLTTEAELAAMGLPTLANAGGSLDGVATNAFIRSDGIIEDVPTGIDPGFAYNVGTEHLRGLADALYRSLEEMARNNAPVAQAILGEVVAQTGIDALLAAKGSDFPVMVLGNAERALVGSDASVARLSFDSYEKQLREHPEIGIAEYRKLVEIGAAPQIILRQGDLRIILIRAEGGKWLKATVKVTKDRQQLYVVNYQYADAREVKRLRRQNEIIRDEG